MLDAVERRHQEQKRLDAIVRRKRDREEQMEKRERELARMGGTNMKVNSLIQSQLTVNYQVK